MKQSKFFKLFSDCIPVKGYNRSIIYDLTRKNYEFIPNDLFQILKNGYIDTANYEAHLDSSNKVVFQEYIDFLLLNEFIFPIEEFEIEQYPPIHFKFDYPSTISNAILECPQKSELLERIISQLDTCNCNFVVIKVNNLKNIIELEEIITAFSNSTIFSIDIILNYHEILSQEALVQLIEKFRIINVITVFKSPLHINCETLNNGMGKIIFSQNEYNIRKLIMPQDPRNFKVSTRLFSESLHFNNFLNKKLFIDKTGNVFNSPFSKINFGNLETDSIEDILRDTEITQLWKVHKDLISGCKDCEFRYMCVDNRTPIAKEIEGIKTYYFEEKCPYDPYESVWQ